ncbi:MAG: hypothetical protein AAFY00_11320, partial [Bacteroidota bacterium]
VHCQTPIVFLQRPDVEEKRLEFDNAQAGTLGLEAAFGCLHQIFNLEETISLLTKGWERFKIQKPVIEVGKAACLTLFSPDVEWNFTKEDISSTSKNSMFLGASLKGRVLGTISNNSSTL